MSAEFSTGQTRPPGPRRCAWCGEDPLYVRYHDEEWGVPVHDDRKLFEMIVLEGAQAGLSWITILRKREAYRRAFDRFDARRIARYGPAEIRARLANPGIVRNRLKIESVVKNARAFLALREAFGSFDAYIWRFVAGQPRVNRPRSMKDIPPRTAESDAMSRDLKRRGFTFVGSTICYAFMQAVGMVDDHVASCFRRRPSTTTTNVTRNRRTTRTTPTPRKRGTTEIRILSENNSRTHHSELRTHNSELPKSVSHPRLGPSHLSASARSTPFRRA
jgi:DNA-3-methyladenine glycosylase I